MDSSTLSSRRERPAAISEIRELNTKQEQKGQLCAVGWSTHFRILEPDQASCSSGSCTLFHTLSLCREPQTEILYGLMKQCSSVSIGDWHPQWRDYSEHQAQSAKPLLKGRDLTNGTVQTNKDSASILFQDPCAYIMNQGYRRCQWYMIIFTGVRYYSYHNIIFVDFYCSSCHNISKLFI